MKAAQMKKEATCRATLSFAQQLCAADTITIADYQRVREALINSYQPPIMGLSLPQRLDKTRVQSDV